MIELLLFVLGLIVGGVVCGALSLPFMIFGTRAAKATPEKAAVRALLWSLGAGCLSSFVLGVSGFVWGASVGDESAARLP